MSKGFTGYPCETIHTNLKGIHMRLSTVGESKSHMQELKAEEVTGRIREVQWVRGAMESCNDIALALHRRNGHTD